MYNQAKPSHKLVRLSVRNPFPNLCSIPGSFGYDPTFLVVATYALSSTPPSPPYQEGRRPISMVREQSFPWVLAPTFFCHPNPRQLG